MWAGWLILAGYGLVVAGWWARHVLISLTRPLGLLVNASPDNRAGTPVSVIVPARNERHRIAECIRTLLAQGPVLGELIVVDDGSDDGTAYLVRDTAAGDARVRILRIDDRPADWAGKAYACQCGGAAATSPWVLFTDADCRFGPGGLAGAVRYAEQHETDLLSLWIRADNRSFWEHMLIPLCGALILYWFPPLLANRPTSSLGYANGQFILIRRDAWRRINGHSIARRTVIEDIPLAQHAKHAGLRLRTALGPDVVSVRMYTSFREVCTGWTRIFIGALQRPWKLLWSVVSILGGSLLPTIAAPLTLAWCLARGWPASPLYGAGIVLLWLHFLAVYSVSYRVWGLCHCARRHLWLYPVSCAVVIALLLRAWWWLVTGRAILWRGQLTGRHASAPP